MPFKGTIKVAFFGATQASEATAHAGFVYGLNAARNKEASLNTRQSIVVLRNEAIPREKLTEKLKILYKGVRYTLHRTEQSGSTQEEKCPEDKYVGGSQVLSWQGY